ncbi:MAG: hypothetical protein ABIB61_02765 [Candidatus Shapirobacteria bacterium]
MRIVDLDTKPIINSESGWSVEVKITLNSQREATASVPQGISIGTQEKADIGGEKASAIIKSQIKNKLLKLTDLNQEKLDKVLLSNLSWPSSATLAISVAFAKAAGYFKIPNPKMPKIMMLIFEGEKHGNPKLTIQEFMIVVDKIEKGISFYQKISEYLKNHNILATVGTEGGFSPKEFKDEDILKVLKKAGAKKIALDIAGNESPPSVKSVLNIVRHNRIFSVEDPFAESEIQKWKDFYQIINKENPRLLIIADDLTVTDKNKIIKGAKDKLFNAVIIKPNQQGTVSGAVLAAKTAQKLGLKTIVSHRGVETNDSWIADLSLFIGADFVKFGAPARGERVAKYNRLITLTA